MATGSCKTNQEPQIQDSNIGDGPTTTESQGTLTDMSLADLVDALPMGAGAGDAQTDKKLEAEAAVEQYINTAGSATLEDLLSTLHQQLKSSDWLKQNTAEKWVEENPELAKQYMEAANTEGENTKAANMEGENDSGVK